MDLSVSTPLPLMGNEQKINLFMRKLVHSIENLIVDYY